MEEDALINEPDARHKQIKSETNREAEKDKTEIETLRKVQGRKMKKKKKQEKERNV